MIKIEPPRCLDNQQLFVSFFFFFRVRCTKNVASCVFLPPLLAYKHKHTEKILLRLCLAVLSLTRSLKKTQLMSFGPFNCLRQFFVICLREKLRKIMFHHKQKKEKHYFIAENRTFMSFLVL